MFRKIVIAAAGAASLTANACGQQLAMVQTVDLGERSITIKVGDVAHKLSADKVELRDKTGQPAGLADFTADQKVMVTKDGNVITRVQRTDDSRRLFVRPPEPGAITDIDQYETIMALQVGDRHYRVKAAAVRLLGRNGQKAQLADFKLGEMVDVLVEGEAVTQVRKT
jgi:hypothetical protein